VSTGVTYPRGFRAAGVAAGMKPSGSLDLAMLLGDPGTTAAGLFTTNRVVAAPVTLSRKHLAAGGGRGVLVNSGQANAATGSRGEEDAGAAVAAAAAAVGVAASDLVACSTGVIGEPLHMDQLLGGLPMLASALHAGGGGDFASAIMTTDTVAKEATADAGTVRVGGAAKGVGMIAPHLATMLAFVTTDAAVAQPDLQRLANDALAPAFGSITVDGCTSTNDTVLLFASGATGAGTITAGDPEWEPLVSAVAEVGESLASQLIHDGEGVSHVMIVDVEGAATDADARAVARAVADSALVKTALFGADPNPGRILQAIGATDVVFDPAAVEVSVGSVLLVERGVVLPAYFSSDELRSQASAAMSAPEVQLRVSIGEGPGRSRMLGCDLSYDYVRINGEYTT
jgi:glutamate N-acetyltransferase / amino-acid N-acetyltransferase